MKPPADRWSALERACRAELEDLVEDVRELRQRIATRRRVLSAIAWHRTADAVAATLAARPKRRSVDG